MRSVTSVPDRARAMLAAVSRFSPGVLVSAMVAVAAQFVSERYGAPAMLMALLLGIALNFLAEEGRSVQGINLTARTILRMGVALLGIRISVDLLAALGAQTILLLALAVVATILIGLAGARLLGRGWRLALITGGSVAICGASAAMAIAAVLPRNQYSERNLIFTVLGVTVLSTIAMIAYPFVVDLFELDHRQAGIFLGGSIHDVAQVVGAGFSVSQETGETATLVKLIRVTMLAPVVLIFSLALRHIPQDGSDPSAKRPPLFPGFVIVFLILAAINSLGLVPEIVRKTASDISGWALLMGIAAVGMKTSLRRVLDVGGDAIALIIGETLFIAAFILVGIHYLS